MWALEWSQGNEVRAGAYLIGWGPNSWIWIHSGKSGLSPLMCLELFPIYTKQVGLLCPIEPVFSGCRRFVFSCTVRDGRWVHQSLTPSSPTNTARAPTIGKCCLKAGTRTYFKNQSSDCCALKLVFHEVSQKVSLWLMVKGSFS